MTPATVAAVLAWINLGEKVFAQGQAFFKKVKEGSLTEEELGIENTKINAARAAIDEWQPGQ